VRRRLEADLERYLEHAAECGARAQGERASGSGPDAHVHQTPLEPTHLELPFGFPGERPAPAAGGREGERAGAVPPELPALDLGEGVLVRGRIDRIDLAPGGEAVVYDYKGAHAPPPDRWAAERHFQIPLYLRAVEELLGARLAGGFYQPLAGRDLRARGLLAEGEGVELQCVRGDTREPAEVRELVDDILAAAREAGVQARAGALQARPETCGFGGTGCMYPTICRCET
jgi:ATP-dependent helicase/nuclease subunit B